MEMLSRVQTVALVLATSVAVWGGARPLQAAAGQPPGGGAPNPQACRTYSTQETRVLASSDGAFTGTITQTCSYGTAANELTCTIKYSDSVGGAYTVTQVARYRSAADFVDEVRVIPPLSLATSGTTTYTTSGPGARNSTWTFEYDAQRRQTRQVFQFSDGSSQIVTHSGWDAAGRTTGASLSSPQPTTLLYAYDDAARALTITTPSVGSVQTHTFNADGNLISIVNTVGGATTTQKTTITGTGRVCR